MVAIRNFLYFSKIFQKTYGYLRGHIEISRILCVAKEVKFDINYLKKIKKLVVATKCAKNY